MARAKTYSLYVNLSASQVRKRLKGYGFGVRKVEASDRNQAVITHTATGDHLRHLESLFEDVISSTTQEGVGTPLENLRNLGPSSAEWLREAGIRSWSDLKNVGPVLAYRLVKRKQPSASQDLLWAMVAALSHREVSEISDDEKSMLLAELES